MTRFKIKNLKILACSGLSTWLALFGILQLHLVRCSEFPERECCDLTTTSTVGPLPIPPAAQPTDKSLSATTAVQTISVGRSGSNIKVASAILNCILARQLCFEDPSCSAILEIIPRVCGPIPVSCSTVTVTKCQAALRTLQAFQFFRPTCLCKEPGMDPDCNHFRDFLFDHPCGFVLKKAEKDPYPIDALPTCNHALSVCQQERKCLKLFEDFKTHCKVRDNKCKMENRDACHDSWTNLRLSPMFGCICPNNHMKKRCDRIFNIVNHNPCVDRLIFFPNGLTPKFKQKSKQPHHRKHNATNTTASSTSTSTSTGTSTATKSNSRTTNHTATAGHPHAFINSIPEADGSTLDDSRHATANNNDNDDDNHEGDDANGADDEDDDDDDDDDDYDDRIRAEIYSNYPHYLHPPSWGLNNPLVLASHSPHTFEDDDDVVVEHRSQGAGTGPPPYIHVDDLERSVDDVVVVVHTGTKVGGGHVKHIVIDGGVGEAHGGSAGIVDILNQSARMPQREHDTFDGHTGSMTNAPPSATSRAPPAPARPSSSAPLAPHTHKQHHKIANFSTKKHVTGLRDELATGRDLAHRTYPGTTMDDRVRIMGMDEKLHQKIFDDNLALIDTPLIASAAAGTTFTGATNSLNTLQGVLTYPFNVSEFHQRHMAAAAAAAAAGNESPLDVIDTAIGYGHGHGHDNSHGTGNGNGNAGLYYQSGQDVEVDLSTEIIKQHFQSTCHTALDTCREDPSCSSSLQPMLMHCEIHRCNRNACMTSLQAFYKGPHEDLNLDIAFCLCKKTTNRHDMCMIAQEKLHPVCAQRPPDNNNQANSNAIYYHPPPACHAVAEACKEDRDCRLKLEYYEQACAVDSVTKKCAGRPSGCRTAMIGILGTMLRTTCACQGTDPQHLYQCVGWRRLLWLNPCVVEAQKDFHMKRLAEMGFLTTTTTTTTPATTTLATTTATTTTTSAYTSTLATHRSPPRKHFRQFTAKEATKSESMPTSVEHNYIEQPDSIPLHSGNDENGNSGNGDYHGSNGHGSGNGNGNGNGAANNEAGRYGKNGKSSKNYKLHGHNAGRDESGGGIDVTNANTNGNDVGGAGESVDFDDDQLVFVEHVDTSGETSGFGLGHVDGMTPPLPVPTTTTAAAITTTTTMATTTTTQPPRNCVVQRPHQSDQLIREGSSKRIYSLDDAECSELCSCGESLTLTCHALCVPFAPCRTALAFYSHASPAYQAYRGRCLCYSGRFICMKPPPGEYSLPAGVFLLLGYSSADEALLRPHTNLGVQDAVRALQQYVSTYIDNQTQCTLTLYNMTDENIIITARVSNDAKLTTLELLDKEREECTSVLKTISQHINSEHHELQSHRLLSIFKMSEVEVVWPEASHASPCHGQSAQLQRSLLIAIALIAALSRWWVLVPPTPASASASICITPRPMT